MALGAIYTPSFRYSTTICKSIKIRDCTLSQNCDNEGAKWASDNDAEGTDRLIPDLGLCAILG